MTAMTTEEHLRDALRTTYVDDVEALPDINGLLGRIDHRVKVGRIRRAAFSSACIALVVAVVAGAGLLRAGPDGDRQLNTADSAAVREPDPWSHPDLLAPYLHQPEPVPEPKPEPIPEPAPEPEPEPLPEPKPAPAPEPKPEPVPEPKPAPAPADTTPPPLQVLSPADGSHVSEPHVTFVGETEPGAAVYTPDRQVDVDPSGRWQVTLELAPGKNVKWFKAKDAAGNKTVVEVVVYYDTGEVAFTANQKFGSSSETPPYDVFWGTATPDSVVHITSDYGSAEAAVDTEGRWEQKVVFETAPPGATFTVTVSSPQGTKHFSFTYTG